MSRSRRIAQAAVGAAAGLLPADALAQAVLRSAEVAFAATDAAVLTAGLVALGGAVGVAAVPALGTLVMPPPPETFLSDLLQFDSVLSDSLTIRCKDGTLVQTVALDGMDYGGKAPDERAAAFARRKAWFDSLAETPVTVKVISTRERVSADLGARYENEVLQAIHDAWMAEFERVYSNTHYLIFSAAPSIKSAYKVLTDTVRGACDALHEYGPRVLDNGRDAFSPLLTFWAGLVNGFRYAVGSFTDRLAERLPACAVTFSAETGLIEYQDGPRRLYQAVVSLKVWGETTDSAIMARILALDGAVTVLQHVAGISRARAMTSLRHRARQAMIAFQNKFVREEFDAAIELVDGNRESLLDHAFAVFLSGDTPEEVERLITELRRIFAEFGIKPAIETAAAEWLWRCRLPGFNQFVRTGSLLGSNLGQLVSFEDEPRGLDRSDWGTGPIRLFKTVGGSAYALQVHVSDEPEALAHTLAIAKAGSGKTTFFQHLIGGALRHPDLRAYIFDRFNGTRIFTTACGGAYLDMGAPESVLLNPLQCDDTPEERAQLHVWLRQLAGVDDDESYESATRAVEAIFGVKKSARSLSSVYDSAFDHGSALKKGLAKWVGSGPLSGWFNGERDSLDLTASRLVGFEMSDVFKDAGASAAMVSYIMHRIRSVVRASALPHFVLFEETAPLLEDVFFKQQVAVFLREHRKLRGSVNLVFQDASAIMASGIGDTILNQCQTVFLFPNDAARRDDYAPFGLTESQWEYIKGASRLARSLRHSCLVKRGNEAVILDLDLRGLGPWLKVYRSGTEPVRLVRELQQKWGADKWLPQYIELG